MKKKLSLGMHIILYVAGMTLLAAFQVMVAFPLFNGESDLELLIGFLGLVLSISAMYYIAKPLVRRIASKGYIR